MYVANIPPGDGATYTKAARATKLMFNTCPPTSDYSYITPNNNEMVTLHVIENNEIYSVFFDEDANEFCLSQYIASGYNSYDVTDFIGVELRHIEVEDTSEVDIFSRDLVNILRSNTDYTPVSGVFFLEYAGFLYLTFTRPRNVRAITDTRAIGFLIRNVPNEGASLLIDERGGEMMAIAFDANHILGSRNGTLVKTPNLGNYANCRSKTSVHDLPYCGPNECDVILLSKRIVIMLMDNMIAVARPQGKPNVRKEPKPKVYEERKPKIPDHVRSANESYLKAKIANVSPLTIPAGIVSTPETTRMDCAICHGDCSDSYWNCRCFSGCVTSSHPECVQDKSTCRCGGKIRKAWLYQGGKLVSSERAQITPTTTTSSQPTANEHKLTSDNHERVIIPEVTIPKKQELPDVLLEAINDVSDYEQIARKRAEELEHKRLKMKHKRDLKKLRSKDNRI